MKDFLYVSRKNEVGTQRRIMIRLYERQYKLKKVKYLTGAKTGVKTLFCSDQLFSSTNAFTRMHSNPTNIFPPIKYLLF